MHNARKPLLEARKKLQSLESTSPALSETATTSASVAASEFRQVSIKLPKIELLRFSGNYTEWLTFRQNCLSHIHTNSDIPIISKFTYLIGLLDGDVKDVIKGYAHIVYLLNYLIYDITPCDTNLSFSCS